MINSRAYRLTRCAFCATLNVADNFRRKRLIMAKPISSQIQELETALENTQGVVRSALQTQIDALTIKLNKEGTRKVKLGDDVKVEIGATVYRARPMYRARSYTPTVVPELEPPKIIEVKVIAINARGDGFAISAPSYSGRYSYEDGCDYFSTKDAALESLIAKQVRTVENVKKQLADAESRLVLEIADLEALNVFITNTRLDEAVKIGLSLAN